MLKQFFIYFSIGSLSMFCQLLGILGIRAMYGLWHGFSEYCGFVFMHYLCSKLLWDIGKCSMSIMP